MTAAMAAGATRHGRGAMSAIDRRLFAESLPARRQLVGSVLFGLLLASDYPRSTRSRALSSCSWPGL